MTAAIFAAEGLHKSYGGLVATDNLYLDLHMGVVHALIGPNGAGKTTALAQLSGELASDSGRVLLEGRDITALPMQKRARLGVARSFQITAIFDDFTVLENVAMSVQGCSGHHFSFFRDARCDRSLIEPAEAALEQVDLQDFANRRAADLAHGQKRQLEIAMALATQPKVLLLDEPMAGMGPAETDFMVALLERLKPRFAMLLIEHDMDVVFRLADVISVLVNGRLLASGNEAEIKASEAVQTAYLREDH